jgi:NifU-like protein involved in Fe-S cluster formation
MQAVAEAAVSELYSRDVMRLAASLPHGDRLDDMNASATRRSPVCGSEISTEVRTDAQGRIDALAFRARACALGQASAALLRSTGIGRNLADLVAARVQLALALAGEASFAAAWPEHAIFEAARSHPGRHAAILLPFDAVIAALSDS